jgi:hypothetical protein
MAADESTSPVMSNPPLPALTHPSIAVLPHARQAQGNVAGQTAATLCPGRRRSRRRWSMGKRIGGHAWRWSSELLPVVARHVEAAGEERWLARKDVVSCHGHAPASPFTCKKSVSRLERSRALLESRRRLRRQRALPREQQRGGWTVSSATRWVALRGTRGWYATGV